ncbi:MAG: tRNA (guanosine(37)-N1)-methyltransferase TrmD [Atribacterota bacterium]|jgi:tRNA (guanine37-N1)-methyltransferase|nr:tRNA (guanosine(37)-N1)-methyltransferase TrmD [Atribacterota bacterium]
MEITVLTIFPNMFDSPFAESIIKRAMDRHLININIMDIRNFTKDRHKSVDDYSYGGGPGMILKPEPIVDAIESIYKKDGNWTDSKIIITSAQGKIFNQKIAKKLSTLERIIFICGRYEGIDERVGQILNAEEISIGDYVLTGGEIPVMVMVDAIIRMIPGVLGKEESAKSDSFYHGLLDYPHFTRPENYRNFKVPEVLLSGDHEKIDRWRMKQSLLRTFIRRPDLLVDRNFSEEELKIIDDWKRID